MQIEKSAIPGSKMTFEANQTNGLRSPLLTNGPLVTAVIATFNRATLVGQSIKSALGQTYKHVEVIVVDDGSTDNTQEVLKEFGNRIRVIHQDNAGPGAARNRGIEAAKGELIVFLDSDDLWMPHRIQRQVAVMMTTGFAVPCCVCNVEMRFTHRASRTSFQNADLEPAQEQGLWLNAREVLIDRFLLFNQMAAVRRDALVTVGGFNDKLRFLEDFDLALRLSLLGPFAFIKEPLAIWNQGSEGSLSKEAAHDIAHLRELEIVIREDLLRRLEIEGGSSPLKRQAQVALAKAKSRLRYVRLQEERGWTWVAVGRTLEGMDRYRDAVIRRSPWFNKMKTIPLPSGHPTQSSS